MDFKTLEEIVLALDMDGYHNDAQAVRDAICALKKQEPIAPKPDGPWWLCGACNDRVYSFDRFCSKCGRKVKWDEVSGNV